MKPKASWRKGWSSFDLDFVFHALGAIALIGFGIFWGVRFAFRTGGPLLAALVIALLGIELWLVIRDARRKTWSPASIGVGVAWMIGVALIIYFDAVVWA